MTENERTCLEALRSGYWSIDVYGRVWRHGRGKTAHETPQRIDRPMKDGYREIVIRWQGQRVRAYVHRLVWLMFRSEVPKGWYLYHIDTNRGNNALSNLEPVTPTENLKRAYSNGRKPQHGSSNGACRLTPQQVEAIRALARVGHSAQSLAGEFGLSPSHTRRIIRGTARVTA